MASNARLLVEIITSLGTFKEDLGRAAAIAEANAKRIEKAFDNIGSEVFKSFAKGLLGTLSVAAIVDFTRETIASAAALNDLSDATGSSVEDLSKLANQAKVAGVDFATLQNAVLKLSVAMSGVDEETTDAARALKVLGVTATDPAKALQEVAVALNKYSDGIGKVAIARALFGREGAAFLATLKDIAEAQDVAATTTTRQAIEAENLEKALRRLSVESTGLKNAILNDIVPALTRVIEQMKEGIRIAGGFGAALLNFGTINPLKDVATNLRDTEKAIEEFDNSLTGRLYKRRGIEADELKALKQRREFLLLLQKQQALAQLGDVSFLNQDKRPPLDFKLGKPKGEGAAKISDAERYLQNLEKQLERTQELTVVEQVLIDIQKKRVTLSGGITQETLLAVAAQIDKAKEEKAAREALAKQLEEEERIRERTRQAAERQLDASIKETEHLSAANDALREDIALVGADEKKRLDLAQARIDSAIALKEETRSAYEYSGASEAMIAQLDEQVRLLKERRQLQGDLFTKKGIAEAVLEEARKIKEFNDIFVNSFADSVAAVATGTKTISGAIRDMERQIVAAISRIAAQNIAEAIFGKTGGGGVGEFFAKLLGSAAGSFFGRGRAPLTSTGGGFGEHFASGTNFAPGGVALVGERGPELVNLPRGAQVIPNDVLSSRRAARSVNLYQTINVLPGASTKSASQAAMMAGIEAQRALARNA